MQQEGPAKGRQLWDVRVPMRDGVELSADVHLPPAGADGGPYPTLLSRSPYNNQWGEPFARVAAAQGYAVVLQDVRGRNDSDGRFTAVHQEIADGYDSVEWCAAQPWSTGRVGIYGSSYLGWTTWAAVKARPPSLVGAWAAVTAGRFGRQEMWHDGCLQLPTLGWRNLVGGRALQFNDAVDWRRVFWHLPLRTMDAELGRPLQDWQEWLDHPGIDEYWRQSLLSDEDFAALDIPVAHVGGWFDGNQFATVEFWRRADALAPARDRQFLLIGPWEHTTIGVGRSYGGADFGEEAVVDVVALMLEWFAACVKDDDAGAFIERHGRTRTFTTGGGGWRVAAQWPPAGRVVELHLASGGRAAVDGADGALLPAAPPADGVDEFRYDPEDPVLIIRGDWNTHHLPVETGQITAAWEAEDLRVPATEIEARPDVCVYTGAPAAEVLVISGTPGLILHGSSDGPDTDWHVWLDDLGPDGSRLELAMGRLRARFHASLSHETLLEPDQPTEFRIELGSVSHAVQPGHRLRLRVSSSCFPVFARNLNTDEPIAEATQARVAINRVHHGPALPSRLVLPVVG